MYDWGLRRDMFENMGLPGIPGAMGMVGGLMPGRRIIGIPRPNAAAGFIGPVRAAYAGGAKPFSRIRLL